MREACSAGGVLLLSVLAAAAGCGSGGTVSGKVTYKGEPVRGGIVVFYGANNWSGNAVIQEDGTYTVARVPKGTVTVTVETKTAPGAPREKAAGGKSPQDRFKAWARSEGTPNPALPPTGTATSVSGSPTSPQTAPAAEL